MGEALPGKRFAIPGSEDIFDSTLVCDIFESTLDIRKRSRTVYRGGQAQLSSDCEDVGRLLRQWSLGDRKALDRLIPLVYRELRLLASQMLRREDSGSVLQTTALVHEAYLRLLGQREAQWQSRTQFFAVAAQLMRRILVDFARRRKASKRGGRAIRVSLDELSTLPEPESLDMLALDDALRALERIAPRESQVVELRFFGGLTVNEVTQVLDISSSTVRRDWAFARAWLFRKLSADGGSDEKPC